MKRILIIQTAFIGDVILATPLIEKLNQHYPDAKIDFLLRKGNENLLKEHPKLNKIIVWKKKEKKYRNLIRIIRIIRRKEYDAVINVQRFFASGFITLFSGAKEKIGFAKNPLSFFFDHKIPHKLNGSHETNRNLSLIYHLCDIKYKGPKLYPRKQDYAAIEKFQGLPYLCVAPTSVWATKQFPLVKWIELILSFEDDWIIYLLGGPEDFEHCEEIRLSTERPNVVNLAGKLNLLSSAALMQSAEMNYVNDSAPMHMASAMGASSNAIFCSTVPSFGFGPLGIDSKVIQTKKPLACRPCGLHGKKSCPLAHFDCAHSIQSNQFDRPAYPKKA